MVDKPEKNGKSCDPEHRNQPNPSELTGGFPGKIAMEVLAPTRAGSKDSLMNQKY